MIAIEKRKGDFPLEIRVRFDGSSGIILNISSSACFIEPENQDPKEIQELFDNAPDKLKFGDNYEKISDIKEDGVRKVVYRSIDY